jgi:hypothetical protein
MAEARVSIDTSKFELELAKFINENSETIAKDIARDAKASVNVVTGNLKKSIRAKKSKYEDGGWIVQATAPHAHLLEFGWKTSHKGPSETAKPFLRPALDRNIERAKAAFGTR